jgi:hypothetical protein
MSRLISCVKDAPGNSNDTKENPSSNSPSAPSNSPSAPSNSPSAPSNSPSAPSNSPSAPSNKCDYCLHTFYNKWSRKQHEKICRHRNETRLLEIELGIEPNIPECNVECRFCNKTMFRTDKLKKHVIICKNRIDYHEKLLKQKDQKNEKQNIQQGNTIINVNNTTNNTINIYGAPRSLEHIDAERIIQFLRDLKRYHIGEQAYDQAGELIIMMENYIQENKANKNFVIPDYRSAIGYIKKANDWEIVNVEKPLNQQFKETAGILCDKRSDIETVNEKVFQNNTNCEIFKHVKQFNNNGFDHVVHGDQQIKTIKSNYKITKLKSKSVCDF